MFLKPDISGTKMIELSFKNWHNQHIPVHLSAQCQAQSHNIKEQIYNSFIGIIIHEHICKTKFMYDAFRH